MTQAHAGASLAERIAGWGWRAVAALPLAEDPGGLQRPFWTDVSVYQGTVNVDALKLAGCHGIYIRAGISWGYPDPRFAETYAAAKAAGLYRSSYHVLYPDQPVADQADNWYAVHKERDVLPRAIDLELSRGQTYGRIADATAQMSDLVLARDGVRPVIYSRRLLIDAWLASWPTALLNSHYWWLAQYLVDRTREHPGNPPTLPQRVAESRVILHQAADKKPPPPGAVQSLTLDWDRWELGGVDAMHAFIRDAWGAAPEQPPVPVDEWARQVDPLLREKIGYGGPGPA